MTATRTKITGQRGRWLAEVNGHWLAVIHDTWREGTDGYFDPMKDVKLDGARYREFVDALQSYEHVVLQKDAGDEGLSRAGYIGVFEFKELEVGSDGSIRLTLVRRIANPK